MVKTNLIMILVLTTYYAFAQQDSIVVSVNGVDFVMIRVDGGIYHRGCTAKSDSDTTCFKSVRGENDVTVSTFYIGQYEVTQELYFQVTGLHPSFHRPWQYSYNFSGDKEQRYPHRPVESVSWYDAQDFIDSLNKLTGLHFRLPTEAEWEYAARGGLNDEKYLYAGSNNINKVTWLTHPDPNVINSCYVWTMNVGGKMPNALELYDMTGNVSEWCSDWFSDSYYQSTKNFKNPQGPKTGDKKSVRGGSYGSNILRMLEVRYRRGVVPDKKDIHIGFRLVLDTD